MESMHTCFRVGRSAKGAIRKYINATAIALVSFGGSVEGNVLADPPDTVAVRNASQFREAVRWGIKHIVITEHLNMTTAGRLSEATALDAGVVAVVPNAFGRYTETIRVRGC